MLRNDDTRPIGVEGFITRAHFGTIQKSAENAAYQSKLVGHEQVVRANGKTFMSNHDISGGDGNWFPILATPE